MINLKIQRYSQSIDEPNFEHDFTNVRAFLHPTLQDLSMKQEYWRALLQMPYDGKREFWLVYAEDRVVGRIGASIAPQEPNRGALGFFDVAYDSPYREEAAQLLLGSAQSWLKLHGADKIWGPLCYNTWFPYRWTLDHNPDTFSWEPLTPPEYPRYFEKAGMKAVAFYKTSFNPDLSAMAESFKPAVERAEASGFTFEPIDGRTLNQETLMDLHRLSHEGFQDNFLFEPISFEMFTKIYTPVFQVKDLIAYFLADESGERAGFLFCFREAGDLVAKSMAIGTKFRSMGLSKALMGKACKRGVDLGLKGLITALMSSGNRSESYARKNEVQWERHYALYADG